MDKTYSTNNIFLAAALISQGHRLKDYSSESSITYFHFDDLHKCKRFENEWLNNKVVGNLKEFYEAYKTLKNLIF